MTVELQVIVDKVEDRWLFFKAAAYTLMCNNNCKVEKVIRPSV